MRKTRLALLTATLMLMTVLGAAPALADASVSWDSGPNGYFVDLGENQIETLAVPYPAGSACTAVVTVTNNPDSVHPGHNLNVYLGAIGGLLVVQVEGFEDGPGSPTGGSGEFLATGGDLLVSIERTDPGRMSRKTSSSMTLTVTCDPPDNGGGEGCTPGYWKQPHHFDSWVATGFSPDQDFDDVFELTPGTTGDWTLLDGVSAKGGKQNALARHGVAALLNSSNPGVSYEFSSAEVIAKVQAAFDTENWNFYKDQLEYENEMGCPLN